MLCLFKRLGEDLTFGDEKTEYRYTGNFAGVSLRFGFRFPETAGHLAPYVTPDDTEGERVRVREGDWAQWRSIGGQEDAAGEYSVLSIPASEALMEQERFLFHAVAFRWRGRAWLICAGSGVGKSTQIKTLQKLYPGEFSVICGDRPILHCPDDGAVTVYPSPWNGKENWSGAQAAPLAGIILLRRGDENQVRPIKPKAAAARVFTSVFSSSETEGDIRRAAAFAERLLHAAPVWEMINLDVPDSTRLMYETILLESE